MHAEMLRRCKEVPYTALTYRLPPITTKDFRGLDTRWRVNDTGTTSCGETGYQGNFVVGIGLSGVKNTFTARGYSYLTVLTLIHLPLCG
jgi:hypothetical protein